jgi:hypothetical protein
VAGPWFTVQKSGSDWETLDTIWLSNGKRGEQAKVQIRLRIDKRLPTELQMAASATASIHSHRAHTAQR